MTEHSSRIRRAVVVGAIPEALRRPLDEHGYACQQVQRPLAALTRLGDGGVDLVVFGRTEEPVDFGLCTQLRREQAFARVALLAVCDTPPAALPEVDALLLTETLEAEFIERALRLCAQRIEGDPVAEAMPLLLHQLRRRDRQLREQVDELSARLSEIDQVVQARTRELATSEHTYRGLIDNNPDAAVVLTPGGQILYQNAIASWLLSELDDDGLEAALEAFCTPAIDIELPLQLRSGDEIVAEIRTASTTWQATPAIVATIRDVTDRVRAEENLRFLATHDELTGLLNRSAFRERIEACFQRCRAEGGHFAILFVDLDRFKYVNDSLGHLAGDRLLRYFAAALTSAVPADDAPVIARIGGDEFAILLDGIETAGQIEQVRERLTEAVAEPVDIDGVRIYLSFSTGVALGPDPYDNVDELVRESDRAMYRAKAARHGEQISYAVAGKSSERDLLRLESALREAIQRREIRAWLQPIVDLQTGQLAGFESLARWHRTDGRIVSPAEFIPLAEQTGLILKLGQQMLEDACALLSSWEGGRLGHCFLTVNLSARHFCQPNLFRHVSELLTDYGIAPERLVLEVTEEALLQDDVEAESVLGLLSDLGVGIAIDDFGTGYSSLDRLRRLPVQKLKIDRCFVEHIATSRREREICRAIVALGRNLGMDIVAEGIETIEQSSLLRDMGCGAGQGFLFAKPLPPDEIASCPDVFLDESVQPLLTAEAA